MGRGIRTLAIVSVIILASSACSPAGAQAAEVHSDSTRNLSPQVPDSDLAALVAGNSDFAFTLYHQINAGDGNLFYSPYSVSIALAMTYAGASGNTATQMAHALQFTLPGDRLHASFNKLSLDLQSRASAKDLKPDQAFRLSVANSLWGQTGFHFEKAFLDLLAQNYGTGLRLVDFKKDPEAARLTINNWVSQSTGKKIKDILPPGVLDALTRLVLADAVYFKAAWENPFPKDFTVPSSFQLLDGSAVQVPMMSEEETLNGMTGDGYSALELPYAGGQLAMLFLLPADGRFKELEGKLDSALVAETISALKPGGVMLTAPKFNFEWSLGLAPALIALGMTDAFDPAQADFSGMDGARDLSIGDVLQKTYVMIDESGTEAAAATVVVAVGSAMTTVPDFRIDHPFFFLIRDIPTGTILFVGRVTNPAA